MQALPFKQVDVFTQKPFWGNPVAVVIGAEVLATEEMQRIAAWTNLSETTFLLPPSSNQADYRLRIFSPKQELPFAGHPTVGSAHAVIESGYAIPTDGKLRQECLAGILDLAVDETALGKQIFVQAPQPKITTISGELTTALIGALGTVRSSRIEFLRIDLGVVWIVADVRDAGSVAALKPDMAAVAKLSAAVDATGVTVFGRAADGISALHVRPFAPAQGVPEDPVCGSGNASVAAFLRHSGKLNDFGSKYISRQGMQVGRDGQVAVRVDGDHIWLGGYAVTCVDGRLRIE
ncbi:MAG TPA: PhzF family phenazine biosynthesis protein [Candidatus Bathyarchaeia archaeon]|nr:PhzF family phenazine biosynthesis protein [Candidatus Bathyarchaeia archaeon]